MIAMSGFLSLCRVDAAVVVVPMAGYGCPGAILGPECSSKVAAGGMAASPGRGMPKDGSEFCAMCPPAARIGLVLPRGGEAQ
ncbi:hypothetical protein BKK81_27120 [Cupriavidus sp. USMAHM13]|uniref:DUF2946 domain-containing protein n=1 Tax=Cupriavidus malaysiensis TaxID=367825 RepID=A0ABM6FDF1_9BURK|nr:hypothetical protein BKK81_27120 [Cupriavidus sp. USMAHM13]AOZ09778.1 hypothetical protein BKK80_29200 [Cupriavidus malaysiensis]